MINEHDAEILRDTIKLLQATARDMLYFYEGWHELFTDRKKLLEDIEIGSSELRALVVHMMKDLRGYSALQNEFLVARQLEMNSRNLWKLAAGPVTMTKASIGIQRMIEKAFSYQQKLDELLNAGMEQGKSEEDRILDLLTEDELAELYEKIKGRV